MIETKRERLIGMTLFLILTVPTVLAVRFYRNLPNEPLGVGAALPQFEVEPMRGASAMPRQGRRVLLFFNPSCPSCKQTILQLDILRVRHPEWFSGDRGLACALISVAGKDETDAFAESISWPIYHDANRVAMKSVRGIGVPYMVLVDENGLVQYRHNGELSMSGFEVLMSAFYQTSRAPANKR